MNFKDEKFFVSLFAGEKGDEAGVLAGNLEYDEDKRAFYGKFPVSNPLNKVRMEAGFLRGTPRLMIFAKTTGEEITIHLDEVTAWTHGDSSGQGNAGKHTTPRFLAAARLFGSTRAVEADGSYWYFLEVTIQENATVQIANEFVPEWQRAENAV